MPEWVVSRPAELSAVVAALLKDRDGTVGITTGLQGAGGFGKTTLALTVCADRKVRRAFRGFVYWVTVGRDVRGAAAVAAKINDVIRLVAPGEDATFTDPEQAGQRLGSLLDEGPRRLLVLDDVWEPEQLAPFTSGGRQCARLVTTRVPGLLGGRTLVRVDQMSPEQSRAVLTSGLPRLERGLVEELLEVTGRWPLLLRLVNKILTNASAAGADLPAIGWQLLARLRTGRPGIVDDLSGETVGGLRVAQPAERARAVRATIEASTSLLDAQDAERFAELGVFVEDEIIPFRIAAELWHATAGLDELQASQLVARLGELALIAFPDGQPGGMTVHDVIRDFLRAEVGPQRLAALNRALLDAAAVHLPAAAQLDSSASGSERVAWWELGSDEEYLKDHLIEHLRDAGRVAEAEAVACDLRWAGVRLQESGPAAPAIDLAQTGTPRAARMAVALARTAHLLAPTIPPRAVIDVLHSRVAADTDWGPQVDALRDVNPRPRLVNRSPLPDLPDPALRRVLFGHRDQVLAVAISPDGSWLVTAGSDGTARIWDATTGHERATLTGHGGSVSAVAISPDGSWLVTAGSDGTARIWDATTGHERATLTGHGGSVSAVAISPDGSWLVTAGSDGTARIWDVVSGRERATLTGHGLISGVAIAPDGGWLATTSSSDGMARIWDAATGRERASLTGHRGSIRAVAISPDGSWLATANRDGTARIWDVVSGRERATLTGHAGAVSAVAISPDSSWLATASSDRATRIWDTATGQKRATLTGHRGPIRAVAISPDGSWLATVSEDGTARIWNAETGPKPTTLTGRDLSVRALAISADFSWLATASSDGTARIWDAATGQKRTTLTGRVGAEWTVAISPDSSWLAAGGSDGTARIWDVATGRERAVLADHHGPVRALAISPDSSWLASAGSEDGLVRVWDCASGRERAVLAGHHGPVRALAISPDSSWLAVGGWDRTVRLWDAAAWRKRAVLAGHHGPVRALAISPDSGWLASAGSEDGLVRVWDCASGFRP